MPGTSSSPPREAQKFDEVPGGYTRVAVGRDVGGWLSYADARGADSLFVPSARRPGGTPRRRSSSVVPAPDPIRLAVTKAYVALGPARSQLAPYKRVRRLEFAELPKTISGKIRRVDLRSLEREAAGRRAGEYREEDFPELAG